MGKIIAANRTTLQILSLSRSRAKLIKKNNKIPNKKTKTTKKTKFTEWEIQMNNSEEKCSTC